MRIFRPGLPGVLIQKILHCSACGFGKIGMTIEEAADYTGIGRNTLRRLVDWGKIPVLRIGRKSIVVWM